MIARRLLFVAALLPLAGCSRGDDADAAPEPTLTAQAVRTVATDGSQLTPGLWNIEEAAGGASAAFAETGKAPAVVLVCDRAAGTVTLTLAETGAAQTKRLTLAGSKADLRLQPGEGGKLSAAIDPTQPVFAGWSDSAQVIEIGQPATLRIPGHVGVGRVFAACS